MASHNRFLGRLLWLLALVGFALAQPPHPRIKTPKPPGLKFLYSMNCTLATPIQVGAGPYGTRTVIPIVGGTFSGPQLNGMLTPSFKGFLTLADCML
jgi:Protein of unknown function (DUF3237).